MKRIVGYALLFIAGAVAGILLYRSCGKSVPETDVVTRVDTLVVRDTITEDRPTFITVTRVDTMLVAIRDTVTLHDTAYVVINREQKRYRGDDYEAWVSGYRPALDSIRVFPETRYITKETISVSSRKRWGIGIQAGYGIGVNSGQVTAFPYIGVGISYNLIRF